MTPNPDQVQARHLEESARFLRISALVNRCYRLKAGDIDRVFRFANDLHCKAIAFDSALPLKSLRSSLGLLSDDHLSKVEKFVGAIVRQSSGKREKRQERFIDAGK